MDIQGPVMEGDGDTQESQKWRDRENTRKKGIFIIPCHITNYLKTQWLKATNIYYVMVSEG